MAGFVQKVGGVSLWSIGSTACCGTPGFCPAFVTTTDPGVATALNIAAATRQRLAVSGTALPPGQSIGGLRVILVTALMPV